MKKSYKKIIIFEIIIFILLLSNSFESSILGNYNMPLFLLILVFIFRYMLGYEKDKYRNKKDMILNILIDLIIYYILYYLLGILIGYARNDNYLTLFGIIKHILPLILIIPLNQLLRYGILKKCGECKYLIILTTLMFIMFDISPAISVADFKTEYGVLVFLALTLLPSVSRNIYLTYITKKEGLYPGMVFMAGLLLPMYILPIIPNPSVYLKSIIDFVLPIILLVRSIKYYEKNKIVNDTGRDYNKKRLTFVIPSIIFSIIIVYFVSGYFRYYAIAVASGSMTPVIHKGDVVIVYKNAKKIKKGDVIAFKVDKTIVVHRMINKIKDGDLVYYYTKGDANDFEDKYQLIRKDIIGVVKIRIPMIGYPTVWLSTL